MKPGIVATAIAVVTGTLGAIAFWKLASRGADWLRGLVLLPMIVPPVVTALALYKAWVALGLVGVLAVSGCIEAFVTPSGLPTWARIGIGALAESVFLAYVFVLGRRAVAHGHTGDVDPLLLDDRVAAQA